MPVAEPVAEPCHWALSLGAPGSVRSVFPRLEPKLPSVQKPIQYVGGELNSTVKDWVDSDGAPGSAGR